jgi:hypothetical protein
LMELARMYRIASMRQSHWRAAPWIFFSNLLAPTIPVPRKCLTNSP